MLTVNQLVKEVRTKRGDIEMPVLGATDTFHIVVKKNDLIRILEEMGAGTPAGEQRAPWRFYLTHPDGTRRLDVQGGDE